MELKATESMNTYFYMKSAIFYFQANNALQEKSIYIKLRDTTRPRIVFYYTFKIKKKSRKHFYLLFLFTLKPRWQVASHAPSLTHIPHTSIF